jgi:hypothetical protein
MQIERQSNLWRDRLLESANLWRDRLRELSICDQQFEEVLAPAGVSEDRVYDIVPYRLIELMEH